MLSGVGGLYALREGRLGSKSHQSWNIKSRADPDVTSCPRNRRLFLPVVITLPFLPPSYYPAILLSGIRSESTSSHSADKPASSATVIVTLSHLHAINAMLPSAVLTADQRAWFRSWQSIEPRRLLRGGTITWIIWVVFNIILGGRAVSNASSSVVPRPSLIILFNCRPLPLSVPQSSWLLRLLLERCTVCWPNRCSSDGRQPWSSSSSLGLRRRPLYRLPRLMWRSITEHLSGV